MAAFVKVPRGLSVSLRCTSTSALAERFGVSSRTIERDLRSLQDAGVPLYATAGRRGGYALLPDFALPPVRLSAQEATACLAALALMGRSPYATHARTAADNGGAYRSYLWRDTCETLGIRPKWTRPYRPQTNGKVARFHRTMADGWAYARCYTSETQRRGALEGWPHHYNYHRPHTACANQALFIRLTNVPDQYA